jgi:hypothetical protein
MNTGEYDATVAELRASDLFIQMAGVKPVLETPPGVETRLRRNPEGVRVYLVTNPRM